MSEIKTLTTLDKSDVAIEIVVNDYIVGGLDASELSTKYKVPIAMIEYVITSQQLDKLRTAHIKHGLDKIKNIQIGQAEKLMDLETKFKKLRLVQLEKTLEDYLAYYSKYNHFYKIHPITGEILKDTNGIPMQVKLPNVAKEIEELKQSVTMSEGLNQILGQIDQILHKPKDVEMIKGDIIDVSAFNTLFEPKKSQDDE